MASVASGLSWLYGHKYASCTRGRGSRYEKEDKRCHALALSVEMSGKVS
jgi:hypothetical protein